MAAVKKIFTLVVITLCCNIVDAQQELTWEMLATVDWSETVDTTFDIVSTKALFSEELLALSNTEVKISGYAIALDGMGLSYALSKNSFAACFFCGKAGPETVMELKVRPKSIQAYEQNDQLLKFVGTLVLKEENDIGLHFILNQARRVH